MNIPMTFDTVVGGNSNRGDLSAATLTSAWVHVRGRKFAVQIDNTAAASPSGTWSFETSADKINVVPLDATLFNPSMLPGPDGTTTAQHQLLVFPNLSCGWFRMKYARTSGGAADYVTGNVEVQQ
jgi:hypothetical protein